MDEENEFKMKTTKTRKKAKGVKNNDKCREKILGCLNKRKWEKPKYKYITNKAL